MGLSRFRPGQKPRETRPSPPPRGRRRGASHAGYTRGLCWLFIGDLLKKNLCGQNLAAVIRRFGACAPGRPRCRRTRLTAAAAGNSSRRAGRPASARAAMHTCDPPCTSSRIAQRDAEPDWSPSAPIFGARTCHPNHFSGRRAVLAPHGATHVGLARIGRPFRAKLERVASRPGRCPGSCSRSKHSTSFRRTGHVLPRPTCETGPRIAPRNPPGPRRRHYALPGRNGMPARRSNRRAEPVGEPRCSQSSSC